MKQFISSAKGQHCTGKELYKLTVQEKELQLWNDIT